MSVTEVSKKSTRQIQNAIKLSQDTIYARSHKKRETTNSCLMRDNVHISQEGLDCGRSVKIPISNLS